MKKITSSLFRMEFLSVAGAWVSLTRKTRGWAHFLTAFNDDELVLLFVFRGDPSVVPNFVEIEPNIADFET